MYVNRSMFVSFQEWAHTHFTKFYGYTSNPDYTPDMTLTTLYVPMRGHATQEQC